IVLENDKRLGAMDRRLHQSSLEITLNGGADLNILVENMGRINFGPKLVDDRKGITQGVKLNGKDVTEWTMFRLPLQDLKDLRFSRGMKPGPAFYRGDFQ